MFNPSPRGSRDDPSAFASYVSTQRGAAELLAARAEGPSLPPPSAENACTREETTEMKGSASSGELRPFQQETLFEVADVWHDASSPMNIPQHLHSSPPFAMYAWQTEILQREESLVRREVEAFAQGERLAQREEQLRHLQEHLATKVAADAKRRQLHEAKCALERREHEVAQKLAVAREEKDNLDARAAELDIRERRLEEEQECLLNDAQRQVDLIHSSARVLQEKEATVAQREESCSRHEAELMLQRECLIGWEVSLSRQQRQLDAQLASVVDKLAAAEKIVLRENNVQELELRLCEREALLWETAAKKLPGSREDLKGLIASLRRLQDKLFSCEFKRHTSSEVL
ncbi:hypothetical protein TraAM80_05585 [Trypanosoma rangeli]|uniref:Uncharacterized protein n=1 Tax=Trypanosoma rangeli TaxID=5698 RepID=A0A3R7K8X9_TRYRA|nr:uncharacterized protein TraAM80_05585 [Trypanosoma rangeli]RNF03645.1 hypothetical protein TraAM80_05585 [Trypanosoma rangeli]|eukprot:RNF03645.1 hypothetical protein TraAM80_05585 [Trypanosoma rangeli]